MSAPTERGASMLMVTVGNLLIVTSILTDGPLSTVLAFAALLVLVPQLVRGISLWRRHRQTTR